ncbi:phosphoribosyl-ATP diphosphatase [Aquabacterium sp. CECT 9606]|uniref:phosphoribosyl-ATP diphosphatase n=1 Tax=Aquabacterium sp. CECT 9606 TaxID=2845822 RepID=UPI001E4E64EF|nr:phosphoribosyl-ATP diphosphatase [Aquabacterium sp. CECT 9606]CAH0349094.1 Phosphoribosyl-ATP pyrophosphatase [Aquabacterium sp. CECT 9606]
MSESLATTTDVLLRLAAVIESRKGGDPDKSYVARLFHKGTDAILKKVGEEATETVMAAKDAASQPSPEHSKALVGEFADLWFHAMVAMAHFGLSPADVVAELARREGLSGLEEFASRRAPMQPSGESGNM